MTPSLIAAPNRVVLKFPEAKETSRGGLIIPDTSKLRPEYGEIISIGEPIGELQVACARWLEELQKAGQRVPISYQSGVRYWRDTYEVDEWIQPYGVFNLTEVASALINHPDYPVPEKAAE